MRLHDLSVGQRFTFIDKHRGKVFEVIKKENAMFPNGRETFIIYHDVIHKRQIICHKRKKSYIFGNISFDSSWELAYFIWLRDSMETFEYQPKTPFKYEFNKKECLYFPDFKIGEMFVEIKGGQFFGKDGKIKNPYSEHFDKKLEAKYKCMLENGVKLISTHEIAPILQYIKDKYGASYLSSFKKNKIFLK